LHQKQIEDRSGDIFCQSNPADLAIPESRENSPEAAAKRALWYCVYCEDEAT
jgi:hypothetical protein